MHNGTLIEIGTHEEVLELGERDTHAGLVRLQEAGYYAQGGSLVPGFKQQLKVGRTIKLSHVSRNHVPLDPTHRRSVGLKIRHASNQLVARN
ncbi:hypothetical protein Mp_zg01120 [Marchantia polymorpha subsp. ruderalis]|uniref:Uncharacterized protein n=2 Tax=Marchantia polymorpha TaxID=3197 RepID=A0A679E623_MARPO|nr:hypothetical protein MARPO_3057s0001 [Marchantia polymorpha]BBN20764.1 hypothetical protein Mp_zg01120 [Marchantia polymorpha subsp. ruderalis]|eukprot:PTQ26308.1 hypothetical protein MARPO_3057s0001 [Marchantia polymorpha]